MVKYFFMKDNNKVDQAKDRRETETSFNEAQKEQRPQPEKTEVKNANAAGQGAIGRTGEKPGPDMNENIHY
jgi:hypothetical protein